MPKSENQKLKLLYILDILKREADENHPMTVFELIERLADFGISAERKSIYADLEALRRYGADLVKTGGRSCGYYIAARTFELPELKLLVDAVQSSRFITGKKSAQLIEKIEGLTNRYDAGQLRRQVFVSGRVKTMNESIYYHVDKLHAAIAQGKKIDFLYFEWVLDFSAIEKVTKSYRKGGERYEVSPFSLCWENENYYLLAYDAADQIIKSYRVDKMEDIRTRKETREGAEIFTKFDIAAFTKQRFGMFGGQVQPVRLCFANRLIGVVIDRFGRDSLFMPYDAKHFTVTVDAAVSPQFFAWLFGLGTEVRILSPEPVAQAYREQLREILKSPI